MTCRATVAEQTARANGTWISDAELATLEQDALVSWLQVDISEMDAVGATYKRVARKMRLKLKMETRKRTSRRRLQQPSVLGTNLASVGRSSGLLGSLEESPRSGTALVGQQSAASGVDNPPNIYSEYDSSGRFLGNPRHVSPDSNGPRVWPPSEIMVQAMLVPHTQMNLNPIPHTNHSISSSFSLSASLLQLRPSQVEDANPLQPLQLSYPLSPFVHTEFFPNAYFYASCIASSYLGFD